MPLISPIDHPITSLLSHVTLTSNSSSVWFKSEAKFIERVSDGLKNTYLSVLGNSFRFGFEGTTIDDSGGVEDAVIVSSLGFHLSFSMTRVESSNALTSSMWPSISKSLPNVQGRSPTNPYNQFVAQHFPLTHVSS